MNSISLTSIPKCLGIVDYVFIALTGFIILIVAYLKINSLIFWQYTSDLFMYDQILQETLQGNFVLEFTYGSGFGDHSYFFLFFLLPIKALLRENMVYVLILLGPIVYGVSAITAYLYFKHTNGQRQGIIYGVIFLLNFGLTVPGLYEATYGFHPDILAGFLAIIFTIFLIHYHQLRSLNKTSTKPVFIGLLISFGLFISLKEEMAVLSIVFFLVLFLWKRERLYFTFLAGSTVFLVLAFWTIKFLQTPFNRTNDFLAEKFISSLKVSGPFVLFYQPEPYGNLLPSYWATIVLFLVAMGAAIWVTKQINAFGVALFVMGLAKMGSSFLVYDFSIFTWHNFPGIIMLTGAVLIQMSVGGKRDIASIKLLNLALLVGAVAIFFLFTIPYFLIVQKTMKYNARLIQNVEPALVDVQKNIEPQRVVTIPPYTAVAWVDGYRYTSYPRGINKSPAGIADYVVLPSENNVFSSDFDPDVETPDLYKEFAPIFENDQFILLKRVQVAEIHQQDRNTFARLFNENEDAFIEFPDEATLR
ncbi:MAG: hypothetical protein KDJ52_03600 [Anaerolineae bacterium]|nr:hypothetical protein [Anaerolineae bacterium]